LARDVGEKKDLKQTGVKEGQISQSSLRTPVHVYSG